jgi:hypothetical protein
MDDTEGTPQDTTPQTGPAQDRQAGGPPPDGTPQDTAPLSGPALDRQAGGSPPEGIVEPLVGAAGWARFIAILGFIVAGFVLLLGCGILVVGFPVEGETASLRFVGLVYIALAAVYLIPLLPLNQFAAAAGRLKQERTYEVAAEALRHNRVFWKRLGILSIIGAVFTVLLLIAAIFLGLLVSLARR